MQTLSSLPLTVRRRVRGVLFDIDDTLTSAGQLSADSYDALERLHKAGFLVIPITGRPAGWCDHIARTWPVDAVVGENGSFYFRYNRADGKLEKRFYFDEKRRLEQRRRLNEIGARILSEVHGSALASDQPYRESDLAIDYCEDVAPLDDTDVERIVELFQQTGANAKVSSIHVNGWFGDYDKLAMTRILMHECFGVDLDAERERYVFVGDSPNDVPMFAYFPHSVGVANVKDFGDRISPRPAFITVQRCGDGFVEVVDRLLSGRG